MAKFRYRMQNILDIKEKMENQAKTAYGEAKTVSGWKLVNAGREDKGYITSACFLQGRNSQTEEWKTLDNIDGNRQNVVSRMIDTPAQVRYVRLMITRPMQHAGGRVLRINEVELY